MADSQDSSSESTTKTPAEVDLDSPQSVLRAFLQFAQADKIPSLEDWYTIPGNFDQIFKNFRILYPQTWEALPNYLHYNVYQDSEIYLPMAPPSPEHEAVTRGMVGLLLDKLQTLRLQPGTSTAVQSFVKTLERRGAEAIILDGRSKLCPDEQLASIYDIASPVIIEVAYSQKFHGTRGLKWKLEREIVDSLGNVQVSLGLKISMEDKEWNPLITLYRPNIPTVAGGTIAAKVIFEQMSLTVLNASLDLTLTLGDFMSEQGRPAIIARFPGLQDNLDLPIPITFGEVAAAVAAAKACVDARNKARAAIGQPRIS